MKLLALYIILCFLLAWANMLRAQTQISRAHAILPYLNRDKQLVQDIFLEADSSSLQKLSVSCYRIKAMDDSVLVFSRTSVHTKLTKGAQVLHTVIRHLRDSGLVHPDYYQVLRKTGTLPAGAYKTYITLRESDAVQSFCFTNKVDSALSVQSASRTEFQEALSPGRKLKLLGVELSTQSLKGLTGNAQMLERNFRKAGRVFKSKGLTTAQRQQANVFYFDLYYNDLYVGYYKLDSSRNFLRSIDQEKDRLSSNASSLANNELEQIQSIFSQVRDLNKKSKEEKEGKGELGVSAYAANGQEEQAASENNYYELRGKLDIPVMNIPVSVEGFYTSQDNNRRVKASYFRLHYDTESAKQELRKLISGYNEKYQNTVSKGKGMEAVYQAYLSRLNEQKGKLLADLKKETGLTDLPKMTLDTSGLRQRLTDSLQARMPDSLGLDTTALSSVAGRSKHLKDSADALYAKAMAQYQRAQELEQQIGKYQRLIDQYKNTSYFDSVLAFKDLKELQDADDLSYKQLAKKANALLPEGATKKLATGLTHFDLGIFNKQESAYTLAGQNIKGLDAGYDFGSFQSAITVGRVEYAGRDGSLDKYTGYSGRVMFRPVKNHKASVIYYGYTPSSKMLSEDRFFNEVNESMPSFRSPVHIVALTYAGALRKNIRFESEVASLFRQTDKAESGADINQKLAYRFQASGDIPNTTVSLEAGYEHVGKSFENNTIPINLSGLDRYVLGSKGLFFRNFLTLGVEYNYLVQQSFSGRGGNSKWGFEVKTNSKRYPSLSLSYKPFATFRTVSDTLDIPQRPLTGAVWTGKASYQIKRKGYSLRFTTVFNHNKTTLDTSRQSSSMFQVNTIYQTTKFTTMLHVTRTHYSRSDSGSVHQRSTQAGANVGYNYDRRWLLNGGADIGLAAFGLSKLGASLGCSYQFQKIPVAVRAAARYNTYRLAEGQVWKQLVGGNIDVLWRFRFKLRKTES